MVILEPKTNKLFASTHRLRSSEVRVLTDNGFFNTRFITGPSYHDIFCALGPAHGSGSGGRGGSGSNSAISARLVGLTTHFRDEKAGRRSNAFLLHGPLRRQ